jgi:two-component system, OmpR family, sensor kinase
VGRLFWKFFLFIWLAQLGGIVAVGAMFWLTQPRVARLLEGVDAGPGARTYVSAAAAILHYGGATAFQDWAAREPRPTVLAVDRNGRDVLERAVPARALAEARQLHNTEPASPLVAQVTDAEHHSYLVFAARAEGPRDMPPPGQRPPGDMPPAAGDIPPAAGSSGPPAFAGTPPPLHGGPPPDGGPGGLQPGMHRFPPRGAMIATLFASLLTAALLAWYVAKPIRSLRSAFQAVSGGHLEHRVAPLIGARHDELADLGREFDRMAAQLQDSMNRQRRLLHDVSHEVRSPLARLQAATGILRQRHPSEDPTVDRIEEEITRIDRLVGDLLRLSRIEAGELGEEPEPVDLRELVSQIVSDANFEAQSRGRRVSWDRPVDATVLGRAEMLHVAFENILRNALKHAPESEIVALETALDISGERYVFRVLDTGPGVREEELPALFTPFFRSASSASTEGYGLGLAIARRSIEAHGGTIRARNRAAGGLEVEIELPLRKGVPSESAKPV